MKNRILKLVKNRSSDLILIIAVFLVFFLTGRNGPFSGSDSKPDVQVPEISSTIPAEIVSPTEATPVEPAVNQLPKIPDSKPTTINKMFPNPVPNEAINGSDQSPLADSLKSLKNSNPSTDDIVDRNAYFKKLTDQLNELQGESSTDSTGSENGNAGSKGAGGSLPVEDDADVGDESLGDQSDETDLPANPYQDLQNGLPPPPVIE